MSRSAFVEVNITNPTRLAQDSQDTANKAVKGVTDLNDPNLMSVIEKQNNITQFAGLTSQYDVLVQNAKDEGIDTTAVTTAYNNLNRFMADILADPDHASDVDRATYKKYQDTYNTELSNLQSALQNNTNNKFTSAANATSQAASTANVAKSAADSAYDYANSEIAVQSNATANAQSTADSAFSQAQSAVTTANSTASEFGKVDQKADSALSNALSAQTNASSAVAKAESTASEFGKVSQKADGAVSSVIDAQSNASYAVAQASSAAADSKDAKQIAGAVSQSYKKLTDGSTMTIAELQNGLAVKLTKADLDGYATQDWSQNQIKTTADGINSNISSIKSTVNGQMTSINDLKADSNGFKDEFTKVNNVVGQHTTDIGTLQADSNGFKTQFQTVNDTIGKHTTDIGSLQATSKELSSSFSSLSTDNTTNKTNISTLSQTVNGLKTNISKKLEQKDLNGYATQDWTQNKIKLTADGINGTMSSVKSTVDGHTTSINDLKADSNSFKSQFTTVNNAIGKQNTDIGTLQATSKKLTTGFNTLTTDNGTNKNDISQLKQTATKFSSTLMTVQTQVQDSAVGTNLLVNTNPTSLGSTQSYITWIIGSAGNGTGSVVAVSGIPTSNGFQITNNTAGNKDFCQSVAYENTVYTFSVYAKLLTSGKATIGVRSFSPNRQNTGYSTTTTSTSWTRIVCQVDATKFDLSSWNSIQFGVIGSSPNIVFAAPKLEKGSLATDWCPNPADNATVTALSSLSQTVDGIKTAVSKKVDNDTYQSYKTQTATAINSKVANNDFNTYKTQTAGLIASKVDNDAFSTYKTQTAGLISSKVANKDFSTYKDQTATAINSKVDNGTFSTYKTQTANAISSKVSTIDFNNLKISNRNLALGTATPFKVTGNNTVNQSQNAYTLSKTIPKGTTVTVSFDVSSTTGVGTFLMQFSGNDSGGSWQGMTNGNLINGTKHVSTTITTGANQSHAFFRLDHATGNITVSNFIISESSKEVSWTPAPEDQATQSQITQLSNNINLRVTEEGLISQINMKAKHTLISSGGQLTLSGKSVFLDSSDPVIMKSANIDKLLVGKELKAADISANTFTTNNGTFTVRQDGSITAKNMTLIGGTLTSPTINASTINSSTINGTTFHGGDIINDANNTSKFYPTTISSDGHIYTVGFNSADAMQTDLSTGALTTKYRAINSSSNKYEAYDTTLQPNQIALFAGYTNGKDMSFTQSVTGSNQDGYVLISPLDGLTFHGDNQQITFNGTSGDPTPKGIIITPYGNINPNGTQNIWYVGNNSNMKTASFGMDGSGINNIKFNRSLDIGNFNINPYHTIASSDGGPIHFNRGNGKSGDIYAATVHYESLAKVSLLSAKKDVKKADTAYWAQLVNSIDLATYQYKSDDNSSHLRLSSIVDDVNDTKQWQLPDVFIARDEDGKLCGVDDSVLLNATLATVQEQQKEIDKLNGHNMELEARLNKLEAKLNG